jgi:hypothetical protein
MKLEEPPADRVRLRRGDREVERQHARHRVEVGGRAHERNARRRGFRAVADGEVGLTLALDRRDGAVQPEAQVPNQGVAVLKELSLV